MLLQYSKLEKKMLLRVTRENTFKVLDWKKKNPCVGGPAQFKSMLFKDQLYLQRLTESNSPKPSSSLKNEGKIKIFSNKRNPSEFIYQWNFRSSVLRNKQYSRTPPRRPSLLDFFMFVTYLRLFWTHSNITVFLTYFPIG